MALTQSAARSAEVARESFDHAAIATQHDTDADPAGPFAAFSLSAEGAVKLATPYGTVTFASGHLAAKTIYRLRFTRVFDTGTDAITVYGYR